jgi:uncharacterized membrane protein
MRNKKIKDLVFFSILVAIIVILVFTGAGFIMIGTFAAVTIIHIPVLIGAQVLGKKYGIMLGFVFGIASMIQAFVLLDGNAPFTNPILSILPRMLFGFIIYPIYSILTSKLKNKSISSAITFGLCTFIHTIIVVFLLFIIGKTGFFFYADMHPYTDVLGTTALKFMTACFTINSLIEVLLAILVGCPIARALDVVIHKDDIE